MSQTLDIYIKAMIAQSGVFLVLQQAPRVAQVMVELAAELERRERAELHARLAGAMRERMRIIAQVEAWYFGSPDPARDEQAAR